MPFNYRSQDLMVLPPSTALGTRGYKSLVMLFNYRSTLITDRRNEHQIFIYL